MAREELLGEEHWRIFRLFLCELSDKEFEEVEAQLEREQAARRERDHSIVRLFYSAMCASDLETAAEQLRAERRGRAEDQRLARQIPAPDTTAKSTIRRRAARRR